MAIAVLIGAWWAASPALSRAARGKVISALEDRFASKLEFTNLNVRVFPRVRIDIEGLVFHYQGRTDLPPLIKIRKFSGAASLLGLLHEHVSLARIEGLEIQVPPRSERSAGAGGNADAKRGGGKTSGFVIDELIADGTTLTTLPNDPGKEPLRWEIRRLTMRGVGPSTAADFHATLVNAKPPGDIDSTGKFGPWAKDDPAETPVSGNYTFRNADLSVFKGISGILSSDGTYSGFLGRIEVQGHTDTPDFTVQVSGNPVHLTTQYHAIVDGTDGNTWLQPVVAQFLHSSVTAQGSVTGVKGVKGKTVSLDVTASNARLEDMLVLGVKAKKPAVSAAISFQTKLVIPPGDVDIAQKLKLDGTFKADSAHFSKLDVQEKVNKLSHSGKGNPEEPETDTVASDFSGHFALDQGVMTLQRVLFGVPGVHVALNGTYGLVDERLDFHGTATLDAKLSETTTGFKSFLLKALDPFFKKKNAGAVIPIKIGGTRREPSFGLDLGGGSPVSSNAGPGGSKAP